jgi:hypothetical protein
MKQTLRIQFDEQSKGVTANVDYTVETDTESIDPSFNNKLLEETKRLYLEAKSFSHAQTLIKNR